MEEMLLKIMKIVKIRCVVLDRAFYSTEVVQLLNKLNLKFVMLLQKIKEF
jgi:hypothetical protein